LHGAGEKGNDNTRQVANGVEQFASEKIRAAYPAFVVVPQCPSHEWWADFTEEPTDPMRLTFTLLSYLQQEFAIDENRIYITGVSMGGFGTWDAITRKPDYFAAAVPVCGGGDIRKADRIVHIPIWAFHGANDTIVDVTYSREMIDALRREGGSPRYTEYPGVGHASWDHVYVIL
jgi:predicted peptidase